MIMEEMKAVRESDADVDAKIAAKVGSQAKAFIENENLLNNYIKGVDPDWAANFFAGGVLSSGAKFAESPEAVEGKKASYIQALGMLFSGTSPDGTIDEVVGDPFWFGSGGGTKKIKEIFNAKGGGWGNPEVGVSRVLASTQYQNNIKKKQFDKIINVEGTEQEKLAANEMMQGLDRGLAFLDKMELAQPSFLGDEFFKSLKGVNETVDDDLGKGKIKKEDQVLLDKHGIDLNQLNAMREEWSTDKMGQTFDKFLDLSLKLDNNLEDQSVNLTIPEQIAKIREEKDVASKAATAAEDASIKYKQKSRDFIANTNTGLSWSNKRDLLKGMADKGLIRQKDNARWMQSGLPPGKMWTNEQMDFIEKFVDQKAIGIARMDPDKAIEFYDSFEKFKTSRIEALEYLEWNKQANRYVKKKF